MMQFASEFTEEKIVAQLSHFVEVLPIKDSLARSKVHGDSQRFGQVLNFVILHQNYFAVSIIFRTFALEREASLAPLPPDKLNV